MACDVNKVISVAESQIGYLEKRSWDQQDDFTANAGDKNYVKYSRDLAEHNFYNGSKKGVAWCDIFVDWCFVTAYGVNAAYKLLCQPVKSCGAGCKYSANYYKNKKQWHDNEPLPGDQIFFWPKDGIGGSSMQHTGLVIAVDSSYVHTIEGNTSSDSGVVDNGGSVNRKKYKLTYDRIAGYGRPDYQHINPDNSSDVHPNEDAASQDDVDNIEYIGTAVVNPATGTSVNLRTSPSKSSARVTGCPSIARNEVLNVISITGDWAKIRYNNHIGYMMTQYLDFDFAVAGNEPALSITAEQIVASINVLLDQLVKMTR